VLPGRPAGSLRRRRWSPSGRSPRGSAGGRSRASSFVPPPWAGGLPYNTVMQTELTYGRDRLTVELRAGQAIAAGPAAEAAAVAPRAAVRAALEHPTRFVPLRRALTPDDRLTIVLDE